MYRIIIFLSPLTGYHGKKSYLIIEETINEVVKEYI